MKEDIISFVEDNSNSYPFYIQMTGISYCDATYKIDRKNSPIYCFEYILKGQGTIIIDGVEINPVVGDVYILHKGDNHLYFSDSKNPWTKIWFNIHGPLVDQLMQVYNLNKTYHIKNLDLEKLFYRLLNTSKENKESPKEVFQKASIIFHEIVLKIYSSIEIPKTINDTALQLQQYIDTHIEKSLSIKTLSDYIFRSPSQTIRIFKKEFGVTPYDYLLTKKIETAKLLLTNTNMPIKQIALKLKFADEHYFSNYFKFKTGCSPIAFRSVKNPY